MKPPERVWEFLEPVQLPAGFADQVGGHPIVAETLVRRGIHSLPAAEAFLHPEHYVPADPADLPDLPLAVERIKLALQRGEKIGVWGDFDVDGQTSTTLLVGALRQLGGDVLFHIPVRANESHGITIPHLQSFLDQGVQLLLTCDTGITAHEAVHYANERNIPVIITDHHQLPPELPPALAAINPQRLPASHPLHPLCGVGCAFQFVRTLYDQLVANPWEQLESFLDLVALGTVADVAELAGDNRWLVQRGLSRLRTNPRPSVRAILKLAEVEPALLTEDHIGFQLAPRLNAIGRLGDANPIVDFFLSEDEQFIQVIATRLEGLNSERGFKTRQIFEAAQNQIKQDKHLLDYPVLVLSHPEWSGGVIGIVASRLVELYQRPAILLTTPPGEPARGSARSIEGIDITRAITACKELLLGFGGHPMAAGMSLPTDRIPEFRRLLNNAVQAQMTEQPPVKTIPIDGTLELEELSIDLARDINRLAPFGPGNPALNFITRGLVLKSHSQIGKNKEHRQLIVENSRGLSQKVLWWQSAGFPLPESPFDLVFNLHPSNFRGQDDIQLTWLVHQKQPQTVELPSRFDAEIIDHRLHPTPLQALTQIRTSEPDLCIWSENIDAGLIPTVTRLELAPAAALVIWSAPPGRTELLAACQKVKPRKIYLFDQLPRDNLLSLVKEAIQSALEEQEGWVSIDHLAANSAQTREVIQALIDLFLANGQLTLLAQREDQLHIQRGGSPTEPDVIERLKSTLHMLFTETQAYRRYYANTPPETLFSGF